jgi:hypothetical protein
VDFPLGQIKNIFSKSKLRNHLALFVMLKSPTHHGAASHLPVPRVAKRIHRCGKSDNLSPLVSSNVTGREIHYKWLYKWDINRKIIPRRFSIAMFDYRRVASQEESKKPHMSAFGIGQDPVRKDRNGHLLKQSPSSFVFNFRGWYMMVPNGK